MTFKPRKQFGQHWLRSESALATIAEAAEIRPGDRLLEIGPGQGVLTQRLLALAPVVAVEIDRDLCQGLRRQFQGREDFRLVEGDFLALDLAQPLALPPVWPRPNKVVANIPYYITGPILETLLGAIATPNPQPYDSIVLLIQKEVADRITANPGSRTFGALSVRVQYLAECELLKTVPARAFYPPPKVDSAIVRLRPRQFQPQAQQPRQLDTLVKLGFSAKRKMLRNNLKGWIDSDRLSQWLTELNVNPQARAEELSVGDWVALSNRLGTIAH